ncbi:hypothetical protein D9M72_205380 [compost metagenome]
MAGLDQVGGLGVAGDGGLHGAGAVGGGNAGGHALGGLDRHGEVGAVLGAVAADHRVQVQLAAALGGQGQADQPAAVLGHEIDRFRCDEIGSQHQVAFILAVFLIDEDDHAAGADVGNDVFGTGDFHGVLNGKLGRIERKTGE